MRLILDIPNDKVNDEVVNAQCVLAITETTTNGDVIKAMFPTADISLNDSCFEGVVNKYGFDMNWWNAKYEAESEDKE